MQILIWSIMEAPGVGFQSCSSSIPQFPYSTCQIVENNMFIIFYGKKKALVFSKCLGTPQNQTHVAALLPQYDEMQWLGYGYKSIQAFPCLQTHQIFCGIKKFKNGDNSEHLTMSHFIKIIFLTEDVMLMLWQFPLKGHSLHVPFLVPRTQVSWR